MLPPELLQRILNLVIVEDKDRLPGLTLVCRSWVHIIRSYQYSHNVTIYIKGHQHDSRRYDCLEKIVGPKARSPPTIPWDNITQYTLAFTTAYGEDGKDFSRDWYIDAASKTLRLLSSRVRMNPESLVITVTKGRVGILHSPLLKETIIAAFPDITRLDLSVQRETFGNVFSFIPAFASLRVLELSCEAMPDTITSESVVHDLSLPPNLQSIHIRILSFAESKEVPIRLNNYHRSGMVTEGGQYFSEWLLGQKDTLNLRHVSLLEFHDKLPGEAVLTLQNSVESLYISFPKDIERFNEIQKKAETPITAWNLTNLICLRTITFDIPQLWYTLPHILRIIEQTLKSVKSTALWKITFIVCSEPLKRPECWTTLDQLLVSSFTAQIDIAVPSGRWPWNVYLQSKADSILPRVKGMGRLDVRLIQQHLYHPYRTFD
ncbi:hypothetical protein Moror_10631 [Moniliophthora roreri MCA 2997]|uniref:F-box domain-containing protein n=2 Tax=Moniliophthora roreri TaxID=221103 RepID=V2XFX5_MONRO|nr:hypothetical protein Moror_10631 [Moniliophthora roreri MCA 2997]